MEAEGIIEKRAWLSWKNMAMNTINSHTIIIIGRQILGLSF